MGCPLFCIIESLFFFSFFHPCVNFPWLVYRTKLPFFLTFHSFSHDAGTKNYTTDHFSLCYLLSICGHIKHDKLSLTKRQLKAARWGQSFIIAMFLSAAISYFAVNENFPRCYYFLIFMRPFNGLGSMYCVEYGKFGLCLK